MYRFNDDNFLRRLNFRPHKPAPGVKGKCNEIPRFLRFKELTEAEMKEKKRIPVPESELQLSGAASSSTPLDIPIYKGTILEKRQKPLTGKESFEVYEVYTLWQNEPSTEPKEICIRWDGLNGRVQLYSLVYMVHPNRKAESGKFLEANGLVGLSMIPHKCNPKKVATGGNWAGQGYWVPYVVALHYAKQWSWCYRYLFVVIWGNDFPAVCKTENDPGYRDNKLDPLVLEAAIRESNYFREKALSEARRHESTRDGNQLETTSIASNPVGIFRTQHRKSFESQQIQEHRPYMLHSRQPEYYDPVRESGGESRKRSNQNHKTDEVHAFFESRTRENMDIPRMRMDSNASYGFAQTRKIRDIAPMNFREGIMEGNRKRRVVDTKGAAKRATYRKPDAAKAMDWEEEELGTGVGRAEYTSDRNKPYSSRSPEQEAAEALLQLVSSPAHRKGAVTQDAFTRTGGYWPTRR
ncbi:hypothetical protein DFH27DRAFT_527800 [Peziza echinospora]|nr:hypothetical protein DFH27DRAFT_527800 [Peziza echinospora]